jgi:hypothetical protein
MSKSQRSRISSADCPPNYLASPDEVQSWFDDGLKAHEPKPNLAQCGALARNIQIAVNRTNNRRLKEQFGNAAPRERFKDVFIGDRVNELQDNVRTAARHLLFEMERLRDFGKNYFGVSGETTYEEVASFVAKFDVFVSRRIDDRKRVATAVERNLNIAVGNVIGPDGSFSYSDAIEEMVKSGTVKMQLSNGKISYTGIFEEPGPTAMKGFNKALNGLRKSDARLHP